MTCNEPRSGYEVGRFLPREMVKDRGYAKRKRTRTTLRIGRCVQALLDVSMSPAVAREALILPLMAAAVILGFAVRTAVRSANRPRCWNCGSSGVRLSMSRRALDTVAVFSYLFPYRCEECMQRYYCFGQRGAQLWKKRRG